MFDSFLSFMMLLIVLVCRSTFSLLHSILFVCLLCGRNPINPGACRHKMTTSFMELTLKKASADRWTSLEAPLRKGGCHWLLSICVQVGKKISSAVANLPDVVLTFSVVVGFFSPLVS